MMKLLNVIKYVLYIDVILVAIFTAHSDVIFIVYWGYKFIVTMLDGNLSNYQNILYHNNFATNYSMLCHIFTALILSPIYFIFKSSTYWHYIIFYKFILSIFTILSAKTLGNILKDLKFNKQQCILSEILYLSSMFVQPVSVMFGQIDFISNFFLLLGLRYLVNKKFTISFMMFSLSYCFKPFTIIIITPILCLLFFRIKRNIVKYIGILISPYLIMSLLTYIFINNFYKYTVLVNNLNRIYERFIGYENYAIEFLIIISLMIFLRLSKKLTFNTRKILTYPLYSFSIFTLINIHYQWELYESSLFIIMIMYICQNNFRVGIFAYIFINIIQIIKYMSYNEHFFTYIFYESIINDKLVINFNNFIYPRILSSVKIVNIIYVISIFFLIWLANKRNNKNQLLTVSQCTIMGILSFIPLIIYSLILCCFIQLKI